MQTGNIKITSDLYIGSDKIIYLGTKDGASGIPSLDSGQALYGSVINNQHSNIVAAAILNIATAPKFFNLLCEDPSAGTMTDVSSAAHNGTYNGTMTAGDRVAKGSGWVIDPDGVDDYISLGDSDDFSFGDGVNDSAVTWFGIVEVVFDIAAQTIIAKHDTTTGLELREWLIQLAGGKYLRSVFYDESANVFCVRTADAALSDGWHTFVITYNGTGGATAADGVIIYVDGILVASTASNNGSYVAMENSTTPVTIGAHKGTDGNPSAFMLGNFTGIGIDKGYVWTAKQVKAYHLAMKGLLNL